MTVALVENAARLSLGLGVVFVLTFVGFALRAHFPVPYFDDWDWIRTFHEPNAFREALWRPHNEHLIIAPRLVLWLDYALWGWPAYLTLFTGLLCHALLAATLVWASFARHTRDTALLLSGPALAFVFFTYQLQGVVFAAAVNSPMAAAFGVVAVLALAHASHASRQSVALLIACSVAACLVALSSLTNAVVVPLLSAAVCFRFPRPARWWLAGGFIVVLLGFVGLRSAAGPAPLPSIVFPPVGEVLFALALLGGPTAAVHPPSAVLIGLTAVTAVLAYMVRSLRRRARLDTAEVVLLSLVFYMLATAAMAGLGRAQFGIANAAQSRYTLLTGAGWCALLILFWPRHARTPRAERVASAGLVAGCALALPAQLVVGSVWAAKADHLRTARLALQAGIVDEDWMWRLHPLGRAHVDPIAARLRARGIAEFSLPDDARPSASGAVPSCAGTVRLIDPELGTQRSNGFRVEASLKEAGDALVVLDRDRTVVGIAEPAPVVTAGRATANDVTLATLQQLWSKPDAVGRWFGFAGRGGGDVAAELQDSSGQPICRAVIDCCFPPEQINREPTMVGAPPIQGVLDAVACDGLRGWAWNAAQPNQPVVVEVDIAKPFLPWTANRWTLAADLFRADLQAAGYGDGRHGFVHQGAWPLPAGRWRFSVSADGVPLAASPQHVTCP